MDILYCDNYPYSLYKSTNIKIDFGMPKKKLHDLIMKYFLHYLEINK